MTVSELQDLVKITEDILDTLKLNVQAYPEFSVNWGDLRCVCAEHFITDYGAKGDRVYIEEADPNNYEFRMYIIEEVFNKTGKSIDVVTEW